MYNFLARWHSYPKTLVVPHQINIPLQNRMILRDNKLKAKRKEKKRKNMCNKVKTKKDKFVQCNSERS